MSDWVSDPEELAALYGEPVPAAVQKAVPRLTPAYRCWIETAPFVVLATRGPDGPDASPRGDAGPVARISGDKCIEIPDWRGNNRIDSLRNILHDPRVALMFLQPGSGNAVRVNGTARITTDPALCDSFARDGKVPRSVIVVHVSQVMIQCARAIIRADLWAGCPVPEGLPTVGQIMAEIAEGDWAAYDRDWAARAEKTMW